MNALTQWLGQLRWETLIGMAVSVLAGLLCITFHEMCHALAAYAMGDPTAKRAGRMTLNPLKHVDILGLAMLAVFKVGWWKPVPIDLRRFKNPKLGMVLAALAGPLSNVLLSALAAAGYTVCMFYGSWLEFPALELLGEFFYYVFFISAGLAVFNLIPLPPLDGSKVLFGVLPAKWYWTLMRYERYGMVALMVLLVTGALDVPLDFLREGLIGLLLPISQWTLELLIAIHS